MAEPVMYPMEFADESDCSIPSFPCFEDSRADDRPFAPPAEDYPIGCEVELRDVEFAKVAQETSHWEPVMDLVFSTPRRRVTVSRHLGEYSFVICTDIKGYDVVGCTLYRACLSEPKVKTTKYFANVAEREEADDGGLNVEVMEAPEEEDDDAFAIPITEDFDALPIMMDPEQPDDAPCPQAVAFAERMDSHPAHRLPKAPQEFAPHAPPFPRASAADDSPANGDSSSRHMTANKMNTIRRRNLYTRAMKRGTVELERQNYETAIHYYNVALKESPEDEARTLSSRSVAYLLLRQTENALKDASRVIELTPESYLGYVRAGNVLRGMKRFNDAQLYYKEAFKRDRRNVLIRKLLLSNSIAMIYDGRTKNVLHFNMRYDEDNHRVHAVAQSSMRKDALVLRESTSLACPLTNSFVDTYSGPGVGTACSHCLKHFLNKNAIAKEIPGMTDNLLRSLCHNSEGHRCGSGCAAVYCSDNCRNKAWAEYHWLECAKQGRWREGIRSVHQYLDSYLANPASSVCSDDTSLPSCPADDPDPRITAASARIAVRMVARMMGCVWALRDAVHLYDWMHVAPSVSERRSAVAPLLTECYKRLLENFLGDERRRLTYELFERCYERARSNAIVLFVSRWGEIVDRAESQLALLTADGSPAQLSSQCDAPNFKCSQSTDRRPPVSGQAEVLQYIVSAPPQGVPSTYHTCLCVFELFSGVTPANLGSSRPQQGTTQPSAAPPQRNVDIETIIVTSAAIRVRARNNIPRGDTLSSNWPPYCGLPKS